MRRKPGKSGSRADERKESVIMLSAVKKSPSDVILREAPIPEPGWDEVLVKVRSCSCS